MKQNSKGLQRWSLSNSRGAGRAQAATGPGSPPGPSTARPPHWASRGWHRAVVGKEEGRDQEGSGVGKKFRFRQVGTAGQGP